MYYFKRIQYKFTSEIFLKDSFFLILTLTIVINGEIGMKLWNLC